MDVDWYLKRYPDIGRAKADPREHYLRLGHAEGRFPNAEAERRSAGSEEEWSKWAAILDAEWYLDRNPDVVAEGWDSLQHFMLIGRAERRRPSGSWVLPSRPVDEARLTLLKSGPLGREVALFVTHSPGGNIKPHVGPHLKGLKREGVSTVLVVASDSELNAIPEDLQSSADAIYHRENQGYDFAAWAHVLRENAQVFAAEALYLSNDSIVGPVNGDDFSRLFARIRSSNAAIVGLTDNSARGWHAQSYFLVFRRQAVSSAAFRDFVFEIVSYEEKDDVINEYETQLARRMIGHGLDCEILFPTPDQSDQTILHWRALLDRGCPYLKLSLLRGLHPHVDMTGWRQRLAASGYDAQVVDGTLADFEAGGRMRFRGSREGPGG